MKTAGTDWDSYYSAPYKTASFTRRYTASVLADLMRSHGGQHGKILEIGGANSCFIDGILKDVDPDRYDVIDNNRLGVELLRRRYPDDRRVAVRQEDVLVSSNNEGVYDIVFSVGLIEHFDLQGTAQAIKAHFNYLRHGGTAIITFPTPTWLYRTIRNLSEITSNWIFHDERPIRLPEFQDAITGLGTIESARILWPQILTQYCVVTRKSSG
ncbi:class I SAM-dependent methyltransferase [Bradyrhizobium sp. S3.9.1]|uniref:class I SAM-dependent methyltransferase n=1 Tax=Bradyrhizobium sp. S3.9.1 TaxID=3156431 RepID=UPI0033972544